jgi:hypothetical protein
VHPLCTPRIFRAAFGESSWGAWDSLLFGLRRALSPFLRVSIFFLLIYVMPKKLQKEGFSAAGAGNIAHLASKFLDLVGGDVQLNEFIEAIRY